MTVQMGSVVDRVYGHIPSTIGTALFPTPVVENAVEVGLLWHSRFLPRKVLYLGTATSGTVQIFTLPSDLWAVRAVEYPYGEAPVSYLKSTDYTVKPGTSAMELIFDTAPGSGDVFGVHYQGAWTLDQLDVAYTQPIALLTAATLCIREAARMASMHSPLIEAEVVDYRDHSRAWVSLKKEFISMYANAVGVSSETILKGAPTPAFAIGAVPSHQRYQRFWWITEENE